MFVMLTMLDIPHEGYKTPVLVNLATVQAVIPYEKGCKVFSVGDESDMNVAQTFDQMTEIAKHYNLYLTRGAVGPTLIP
jgi:hypothetical protein